MNKESTLNHSTPLGLTYHIPRVPHLLELWEDFRYLAEMIFKERMASTAASSTSALFRIRPERKKKETRTRVHLKTKW